MRFFGRFTRPKATLRLEMAKDEFFLGEEMRGDARLKSDEEFDIERLSVRLSCYEHVRRSKVCEDGSTQEFWDSERLYLLERLYLTPPFHVNSGFDSKYAFVFRIPASGRESYSSYGKKIEWVIVSCIAGKKRKEIVQAHKILVAKPTESVKEVIKEVVMVPCPYCGGLMPNTALFCPNCGAKKKQ
jgi:hypothetical protein